MEENTSNPAEIPESATNQSSIGYERRIDWSIREPEYFVEQGDVSFGNASLRGQDYSEAIECYSRALELDPSLANVYESRGSAHLSGREYGLAIDDLSKVLELDPDNVSVYYPRGACLKRSVAYTAKGEHGLADADFSKVLRVAPDSAGVYFQRGILHTFIGKHERAIADLGKAIELSPDFARAYFVRGEVHLGTKNYNQAIEDFSKFLELNPDYSGTYTIAGSGFGGCDPIYPEAHNKRGYAYTLVGKLDLAINDFSKALELKPNNPDAQEALEQVTLLRDTGTEHDPANGSEASSEGTTTEQ